MRGIRSFRKLTGEGMTLVGSEILRLLEEVLPARFGGSSTDYQLHEVEDERGLTRLEAAGEPACRARRGTRDRERCSTGSRDGSPAADLARATWAAAGTLSASSAASRSGPGRGKLMPLHFGSNRRPRAARTVGGSERRRRAPRRGRLLGGGALRPRRRRAAAAQRRSCWAPISAAGWARRISAVTCSRLRS